MFTLAQNSGVKKMDLNAEEFRRRSEEFFANSYLTSLGVVQSVVLGLLAYRSVEIQQWDILAYLEAIGSFAVILLVVEEYHWFLLIIRRVPTFVDTLIPYTFGALELTGVEFVGDANGRWSLIIGLLALIGVASYINTYRYCSEKLFRECMWFRAPMLRIVEIDIMFVFTMACVLFATWITWDMTSNTERVIGIVVFYFLIAIMIGSSVLFLERTRKEFKRLAEVVPSIPLRPR